MNFDEPNPHIPWDKLAVKVVTEATNWPSNGTRRIANVSAFGMSGTNAHAVIEAPEASHNHVTVNAETEQGSEPQLLVLSGKSEEALQELAEGFEQHLLSGKQELVDIAYTTCVGRSHLDQRAAIVTHDREQAIAQLKTLARLGKSESLFRGNGRRVPKVAWQFYWAGLAIRWHGS